MLIDFVGKDFVNWEAAGTKDFSHLFLHLILIAQTIDEKDIALFTEEWVFNASAYKWADRNFALDGRFIYQPLRSAYAEEEIRVTQSAWQKLYRFGMAYKQYTGRDLLYYDRNKLSFNKHTAYQNVDNFRGFCRMSQFRTSNSYTLKNTPNILFFKLEWRGYSLRMLTDTMFICDELTYNPDNTPGFWDVRNALDTISFEQDTFAELLADVIAYVKEGQQAGWIGKFRQLEEAVDDFVDFYGDWNPNEDSNDEAEERREENQEDQQGKKPKKGPKPEKNDSNDAEQDSGSEDSQESTEDQSEDGSQEAESDSAENSESAEEGEGEGDADAEGTSGGESSDGGEANSSGEAGEDASSDAAQSEEGGESDKAEAADAESEAAEDSDADAGESDTASEEGSDASEDGDADAGEEGKEADEAAEGDKEEGDASEEGGADDNAEETDKEEDGKDNEGEGKGGDGDSDDTNHGGGKAGNPNARRMKISLNDVFMRLLRDKNGERTKKLNVKKFILNIRTVRPISQAKIERGEGGILLLVDISDSVKEFADNNFSVMLSACKNAASIGNCVMITNYNIRNIHDMFLNGKEATQLIGEKLGVEINFSTQVEDIMKLLLKKFNINNVIVVSDWDGEEPIRNMLNMKEIQYIFHVYNNEIPKRIRHTKYRGLYGDKDIARAIAKLVESV